MGEKSKEKFLESCLLWGKQKYLQCQQVMITCKHTSYTVHRFSMLLSSGWPIGDVFTWTISDMANRIYCIKIFRSGFFVGSYPFPPEAKKKNSSTKHNLGKNFSTKPNSGKKGKALNFETVLESVWSPFQLLLKMEGPKAGSCCTPFHICHKRYSRTGLRRASKSDPTSSTRRM